MVKRTMSACLFAVLVVGAYALIVYRSIPNSNTTLTRFDTLIVLGYPCNDDGTPSPEQRERVLESVREFQSGVASHIIMSGTAAHNRFVEADSMKSLAIAQGVPAASILEETQAQNTLQNILYSSQIMSTHHWTSAEIVSSSSHLSRASLILQHYPFAWRTHPSRWPQEYNLARIAVGYAYEIRNCWQIRLFGFPPNAFPVAQAN